jgi:hypothetical protein
MFRVLLAFALTGDLSVLSLKITPTNIELDILVFASDVLLPVPPRGVLPFGDLRCSM